MADELATSAPLDTNAPVTLAATPSLGPGIGSPAFQAADQFTAREEGGKTANDGTGHAAAYGIDQSAHPGVDVMSLTPEKAQQIRYGYWTAVNGDALAQVNPKLALAAYDTAIMAGPEKAKQLVAQSGGDPAMFMQLRANFLNGLVKSDPARYGPVAAGWAARDQRLAQTTGLKSSFGSMSAGGEGGPLSEFPVQAASILSPVTDAAAQTVKKQAAPAAPAAPNPQPLGLSPQPVTPAKIPSPMETYLALLHRGNPLQQGSA